MVTNSSVPKSRKRTGRIVETHEKQVVDKETGEVVMETHEKVIRQLVEKDQFMKVYTKQIGAIIGLSSPLAYRCLFYLWSIAEYNTNKVIFLPRHRDEIMETFKIKSTQSIYNAITSLVKSGLLIKGKYRLEYTLNPAYFFYGEDIHKSSVLNLVVRFDLQESSRNDENGEEV